MPQTYLEMKELGSYDMEPEEQAQANVIRLARVAGQNWLLYASPVGLWAGCDSDDTAKADSK